MTRDQTIKAVASCRHDPSSRYFDEELQLAEVFVAKLEAAGVLRFREEHPCEAAPDSLPILTVTMRQEAERAKNERMSAALNMLLEAARNKK